MASNFETCLAEVLKHEGGYSNHAADPGGATNLGVTQRVYEDWVKHKVTADFMRTLTLSHVKALYKANYWDVVKAEQLGAGLDLCVFDFAVNAGPKRAVRYLQLMCGAKPDGVMGPDTLRHLQQYVRTYDINHAISRYQELRAAYYPKLATFATFGRGWLRRVREVTAAALKMAR